MKLLTLPLRVMSSHSPDVACGERGPSTGAVWQQFLLHSPGQQGLERATFWGLQTHCPLDTGESKLTSKLRLILLVSWADSCSVFRVAWLHSQVCEKEGYHMTWAVKQVQEICKVLGTPEKFCFIQHVENMFSEITKEFYEFSVAGERQQLCADIIFLINVYSWNSCRNLLLF